MRPPVRAANLRLGTLPREQHSALPSFRNSGNLLEL